MKNIRFNHSAAPFMKRIHRAECGAQLGEYALSAGILIPIFIAIAFGLQRAMEVRSERSTSTIHNMTPESEALASISEDAALKAEAGAKVISTPKSE